LKPFASGTVDRIARESMARTLETFSVQTRQHAQSGQQGQQTQSRGQAGPAGGTARFMGY
jgi:GTPase involved in cell partitioning and DNA repair